MSPAMVLHGRCPKGHPLTPDNSRLEKSKESASGFRIRCKTCVRLRWRNRYRNDPAFRARYRAYANWFSNGHPEGKQWSELKEAFEARA